MLRSATTVDDREVLGILERVASEPTAPFHEWRVLDAIQAELRGLGLEPRIDDHGQVFARLARGSARRALVLVAHTDHPAFEVVEARGTTGVARLRGGVAARYFARDVALRVHRDGEAEGWPATIGGYTPDVELPNWSPGRGELRSERPLRVGDWAVLDLPAYVRSGDELQLRAADDLAGCALVLGTLGALRSEQRPFDVQAVFTRAEEAGLFGARLLAEERSIPADAYVVSVEASDARYARAGGGIVVRVGDLHNTFSNEAERYLRVAQERLGARGIPTQRALLPGGTCEASAFVRLGWIATGIALPNTAYHNAGPNGRLVPEVVRHSDLRSGIALAAEAAVAGGEDASEAWWPETRVVPADIRALLGRSPAH